MIQLTRIGEEWLQLIPPPTEAVFPEMVHLVMVGEEPLHSIPPPAEAELSVMTQSVMTGEEDAQPIPPPLSDVELPVIVHPVICGVESSQYIAQVEFPVMTQLVMVEDACQ